MQEQDPVTDFDLVKQAPLHIWNFLTGFVLAVLSDVTMTSMAIASAAIGYGVTWWAGVATFFSLHVATQMVNSHASGVVAAGRAVRNGLFATVPAPQPSSEENSAAIIGDGGDPS